MKWSIGGTIAALIAFASPVQANYGPTVQVKFGGWSKHYYESPYNTKFDLNESHSGFGLQLYQRRPVLNFFDGYSFDVWYMKDSFYKDQIQGGMTLYKDLQINRAMLHKIQFALTSGFMSRSRGVIKAKTGGIIYTERINIPFILPGVSWYVTQRFNLDFTYIPKLGDINEFDTIFFRAGYDF